MKNARMKSGRRTGVHLFILGSKTWIPFESYDSHFVWHALNIVIEKKVRESLVDEPTLSILSNTTGLYDPVLPIVPTIQKPSDIDIPHVNRYQLTDLPDNIQSWLKFEGEQAVTKTILENGWVSIVDDYDVSAGCTSEKCVTYPFLASEKLSNAFLNENYSSKRYEYKTLTVPNHPYFSLSRLTAKELLVANFDGMDHVSTNPVPLVNKYFGSLWSRSHMHVSIAGRWIREYGLKWRSTESLDLCRNGDMVQRIDEWSDGVTAKYKTYQPVGRGTRLCVKSDFLETIMDAYNLRLIIVSEKMRRLSSDMNLSSETGKGRRKPDGAGCRS